MVSTVLDMSTADTVRDAAKDGQAGVAEILNKMETFVRDAVCNVLYDNTSSPVEFRKVTKNLSELWWLKAFKKNYC